MRLSNSSKAEFEKMLSEAMEKEDNKNPADIDLFAQIDYSNNKVTIEIDSDVFDLARCLCFIKPTISPQDLLSNIVLKGIIDACDPYSAKVKSTFKRNPYDRIVKCLRKEVEND